MGERMEARITESEKRMDKKLSDLETRMDERMEARITESEKRMDEKLFALETRMDARFAESENLLLEHADIL